MMQDELEWIDAHQHLWDLSRVEYPWILAKGEIRFFGQPDPIRKDYLLEQYLEDTAGRISRSIHVQVGAKPGHELRETEFVSDCSRLTGNRIPAAAVVAVNMGEEGLEQELESHLAFSVTRGVRQMIGKSAEENPSLPPFVPDVWVKNWRLLPRHDLSFDLQLTEEQYPEVLAALERVPELRVAICHLASPWDRSEEGMRRWCKWMKRFAALPNAKMKISGLCMFTKKWGEAEFLRWAMAALDIFGADRCMLGSNFPVDSLYVSYDDLFAGWQKLLAQCSPGEAMQLAGKTAADFYRL